ncbi:MAG: beta-glucosidase [Clostridiaceae bacterium]|nr:beta-glucosidase [Clostridiaceae bacterium]
MIYKDPSRPVEERARDLLSRMTLDEKIAQMTWVRLIKIITDRHTLTFSGEKAAENIPHGIGYINRIGGETELRPAEMADVINSIQEYLVKETRLGIPALFVTEATSGVLSRDHTLFPQNIGAAAMFNEDLVRQMGDAVRKEMLSTGERLALAPVVDVVRDHRFGRCEESFGEDVYLVTQYSMAYTKGLQSDSLKQGIAATLKHFAAQGISDGGRNCAPIHITKRELLDCYTVPFEAAIREANAACVMAAYHEWHDRPCHVSEELLFEILGKKLGFDGLLMADGNGIKDIRDFHGYCETLDEAIVLALKAGIQMELLEQSLKDNLKPLVENGRIDISIIDRAVEKMLALKFRLGLFDNPYVDVSRVSETVCCRKHREIAGKMARQSLTLLKNKHNILPLSPDIGSIAVVGPLADRKEFAYSDYSYPSHIEYMYYITESLEDENIPTSFFLKRKDTRFEDLYHDIKTVYQAICERVAPSTRVYLAPGLKDTTDYNRDPGFYSIGEAVEAASRADVVIAVCGDTSGLGHENDSGESVDRVEIYLSHEQRTLLKELKMLGKPIILVLCNGRPLELSYENMEMDAILEAWRPGMEGADAIADALFGKYNPGGRLPVSLPKSLGQLPIYYSQHATGKTQFWKDSYLEMDTKPLYPFGYGLSYSRFRYGEAVFSQEDDRIRVKVTVLNEGPYDGDEVVQVYVRKRFTSVIQPERELKAYKRVSLKKGEQVALSFDILYDSLAYHNKDYELGLEDCVLDVMVGSSSEDIHHQQSFRLRFENGMRKVSQRVFANPAIIE